VLTLPGDLDAAVRSGELARVKGIGKTLAGVIMELTAQGQAQIHQDLKARTSPGLMELLKVPGLGPKKARLLHEQLQIGSLGELEYACRENRLVSLPGFGAKTQEKIMAGLAGVRRYAGLFRLGDLLPLAEGLLGEVRRVPGVLEAELAGDLRRRLEIAPGIDLAAAAPSVEEAATLLGRLPFFQAPTTGGPGRLEGLLPQGIRVRLTLARPEVFGAALLVLTGNAAHLQDLRAEGEKLGLTLTESGLFQGGELLPSREEEIYRRLGLPFIPPELREGLGEVAAAKEGRLPRLVTREDLKGCFHVHSYYSDGVNSPEELLTAVRDRGWEFLGLSDHSQSAYYAGGLKPPDLERQRQEVAALRRKYPDLTLFWGVESDILPNGSLDYADELLADFDFVIASVHSQFNLNREAMTRRILAALGNPHCTMLGHVSGRLLLAREPYAADLERILEFAQKNQIIMELNASPYRLDLDWRLLKKAREMGVLISINPDAHSLDGLDDVAYGVMAARKGWLAPEDVLNTYPAAEAARWLRRRRGAVGS
jgi:DNA polymerase (family 10)